MNIDRGIMEQAVMESRDGIVITDPNQPDNPLVFVNAAFEKMTGYNANECIGKNCRFLQKHDNQSDANNTIKEALQKGESCLVTLRNYRKNGDMFWNELSISPVRDNNHNVTHFIGIQKDVTDREIYHEYLLKKSNMLAVKNEDLQELCMTDSLTGLNNRRYLNEQYLVKCKRSKQKQELLTLFLVDIDHFKFYNDTYGHLSGDDCLKKVAKAIAGSFRQPTDIVCRYGGEEFIVLVSGLTPEYAAGFAERIKDNVCQINIPHESSLIADHVTVSVGYITFQPDQKANLKSIIEKADVALYRAKNFGRNQIQSANHMRIT